MAIDACIETSARLCICFENIIDFHYYVCNVEGMANEPYEDFIRKLEEEEGE